ncbi:MAG: hypothetical protein KFB95_08915 [Simkaniaceae bacterium]|nr:MAG: hypothetical protein KFB95_08915 [Simkaniaceae bacterium]
MTEQLSRHPRRQIEPHPLDGAFSIAIKLITTPFRGLHYIEKSLTGTYTADQDFFSRYHWTKHHVEDLHKSLSSPNFWVKWSRQGNATYIEIQDQLSTLHREREKARAIYQRQRYYRGRPILRDLSTRAIACTDLSSIDQRLHDIHLRTTKASGQSYIDKKQKDATEIQTSIASLKSTPIESSWETWLLKHQTTCRSIQSSISALNHTTYLCVSEGREKLQGINTQDLNTLLYNALVDIAKTHYTSHAQKEYHTLYESTQRKLKALQEDHTTYHKTWGNYLWSNWEKDHRQDAYTLHIQLSCLRHLHSNLIAISRDPLPSLYPLQQTFNSLFRSFVPPEEHAPFRSSAPDTWQHHPHRGSIIHTGEPHLTNTLQLAFSDPKLAAQTTTENRQLKQLYHQFLNTTWNIQWDALYQLITKPTPQKPTHPYQQFIATYQKLTPTHAVYPSRNVRLNPEAIFSNQTILTLECAPNQAQEERVPADTLETLLTKHSNAPQEKTYFTSPPEYLIINLQRTRENQDTPIGLQEEFFLLPTHTTSRKGAAYELISFTSSDTHYRKTPFGYTRISNTLEEITQLDFLIAAQTASTCVLRRSDTNIPELELFQRAQQNRLHFSTLQFKISAIHAIYGQSTFKIPAPHQTTFQHLVDFIQCVAKTSSLPERMFGKNPNDDLERTFQKLPKTLQTFLLNTLHAPNKNPALLRDLRTHLLTSEETLSIPPIAGQQQHDVDRFVLTLIADRLVKHFASHTESILKNEDQLFLLQATLHAVSQNVQAKRKRVIRYSAAAEETIQLTVTLVFSNYLEKGEEFLIRQAISSGTRLITVMGDPLQESRLFQTAMRTTTAIILLGQSLDNPELSEQDVRNTGIQFFARQGIALISLESVPQPVQDLAIATLSTAIFRSPSHLINWGVSTTFTLINTTLVDDLPPDVPQPALKFYRARILNPLLTNGALQAFTAEKVTQLTLHLLRSLEDSDHTTEDLTPTVPVEETPQVEMHDRPLYLRLVQEQEQNVKDLAKAQAELDNPDYSEFGSPKKTLIQREAGVTEAKKKLDEKVYKEGDTWGPWQARRAEKKTEKAQDNYNDAVRGRNTVKTHITNLETRISKLNIRIASNSQAQLEASAPKHIVAPTRELQPPMVRKDNKYHHLAYVDTDGEQRSLGKYDNADDTRLISGAWAGFEATRKSQEFQCYDAQNQLAAQGIKIEEIPQRPQLEIPRISGKDADVNYQQIQASRVRNQKAVTTYLELLNKMAEHPLQARGLSKAELRELTQSMTPKIKDPKKHGFWYGAYRKPGQKLTEFRHWCDEKGIQVSGGEFTIASTGINTPKPTNSTPSYAGTYGPEVASSSSVPAPSYTHAAPTPSPATNWGWQNVEEMQQHQIFERNMAYQSPVNSSPQAPIDYQTLWGEGVGPQVQLPPTTFDGAPLNNPATQPPEDKHPHMAGFAPLTGSQASAKLLQGAVSLFLPDMSDMPGAENPMDHINRIITPEAVDNFAKSIPKGIANILIAGGSLMLPDMSDVPGAEDPREHFKRFSHNALLKYDNIMQIDPHAFSAKAGEFVGEMFAFGGLGKVIRVAEGISVFGMACEGGMVGLVVSEAHDTNKVAGVAFGFIGGAAFSRLSSRTPHPLADRALTMTKAHSRELRFLRSINEPAYRSGFVNENTIGKLRNSVSEISPKTLKSLERRVSKWLGDGTRLIRNRSGDPIFLSQDKMRRVRFDFNRTYPHENPHLHFEKKLGEEWKNVARIYPKDLPHK